MYVNWKCSHNFTSPLVVETYKMPHTNLDNYVQPHNHISPPPLVAADTAHFSLATGAYTHIYVRPENVENWLAFRQPRYHASATTDSQWQLFFKRWDNLPPKTHFVVHGDAVIGRQLDSKIATYHFYYHDNNTNCSLLL